MTDNNSKKNDGGNKAEYIVKCHCGLIRGKFMASSSNIIAWNCNCSDCIMRGNVHVIIPQDDFELLTPLDVYDKESTLYEWGTKTAKRRFCKTCGILPWYRPRSNPDGYGITLRCIDFENSASKPKVEIKTFDGQNWEKFFETSNISEQSKK